MIQQERSYLVATTQLQIRFVVCFPVVLLKIFQEEAGQVTSGSSSGSGRLIDTQSMLDFQLKSTNGSTKVANVS